MLNHWTVCSSRSETSDMVSAQPSHTGLPTTRTSGSRRLLIRRAGLKAWPGPARMTLTEMSLCKESQIRQTSLHRTELTWPLPPLLLPCRSGLTLGAPTKDSLLHRRLRPAAAMPRQPKILVRFVDPLANKAREPHVSPSSGPEPKLAGQRHGLQQLISNPGVPEIGACMHKPIPCHVVKPTTCPVSEIRSLGDELILGSGRPRTTWSDTHLLPLSRASTPLLKATAPILDGSRRILWVRWAPEDPFRHHCARKGARMSRHSRISAVS